MEAPLRNRFLDARADNNNQRGRRNRGGEGRGRGGRGHPAYRGREGWNPRGGRGGRFQDNNDENVGRRHSRSGGGRYYQTNQGDGIPPTGYQRLKDMAEDDEIEGSLIILRLAGEQSGFSRRLRQDMDGGMTQIVLKVIGKMCREESPPDCFGAVLTMILENKFTEKLVSFLHGLIKEGPMRRRLAPTHVSNALDLLKAWVERIPTTSETQASFLLTILKHVVTKMEIGLEKDIAIRLEEISTVLEELDKKYHPPEKPRGTDEAHTLKQMHKERPTNNFRDMSVFPKMEDINGTDIPFIRTNLVNSAYNNNDHYLDVQFRLLREDFVRPLREGIRHCFTLGGEMRLDKQKQHNVKVYENVSIEFPLPGKTGIQYCVHFNPSRLRFVNWEISRRLMFGNLVCLSADKFKEHFLFASISEREPRSLKMGYVTLEFVSNTSRNGELEQNIREAINLQREEENLFPSDDEESSDSEEEAPAMLDADRLAEVSGNSLVSDQDMRKKYYMVETEAYFEAYKHVLSGLQKVEVIPMDRYIVYCRKEVQNPRYIRARASPALYEFSDVLKKSADASPLERATANSTKVDILNNESWPSAEDLQLDASQVAALKSALTNELSVIQGPPGTGKTHVGLVIMKLLLNATNRSFRDLVRLQVAHNNPLRRLVDTRKNEPAQILVVCYTNHALDQFLEGIAEFHRDGQIIRVGGRCKTKSLECYSLNNVRRTRSYASVGTFQRKTVWEHRRDLENQRNFILAHTTVLDVSTHSIISLKELQPVIPAHMHDQLTETYRKGNEALLQWLGVTNPDESLYEKKYIVREALNAVARGLVAMGYSYEYIVSAVRETGTLEQNVLIEWMTFNLPAYAPFPLPNPDDVYAYLDQLSTPFDPEQLIEDGFHPIEIKCALLVIGFNRSIEEIRQWLKEQNQRPTNENTERNGDDTNTDVDDVTRELNEMKIEDDDIEFIRDQRQIDEDYEDGDDFEFQQRRQSNAEAMKKLEKEYAAATYDEIKSDMKVGRWQFPPEEIKRRKKMIKDNIGRVDKMSKRNAENVTNIFRLNQNDRWKLYRRWVHDLRSNLRNKISRESVKYNQLAKALTNARNEEDYAILRTATVIGMTTTGAAKYRDIVHRLPAKVVVVEEAAEVLEAHIVTSMPRATEHLILIGDHQQLKPSPTVYELARKFNLDVSLFERMINNGIPCNKLALQHRMRPKIADLLRPHIYENLLDHESVLSYERIIGMQKNIFFLSHEHEEDSVQDGRSKVNGHEATFLVSLSQYLIQQGYQPDQITILTAYVGQLHVINRLMRDKLRKIRVTAIDNFQGEENEIILLSLVRSNEEGKIGFLGIENRVCVALSRAKKGLFCIGNSTLLKEKSGLWRTILSKLERDGMVGDGIPLQCKNHPENLVLAKSVEDFQKVPEGGCGKPCQTRLPCGHVCTRSCHPDDEGHELFKCRKPCQKSCENGHKCKLPCFKECCCTVLMTKKIPKCGHEQIMRCFQNPTSFCCKVPCTDELSCGHKCAGICGKPCPRKCSEIVTSDKPPCGHPAFSVECYRSNEICPSDCKALCDVVLKCGHQCRGTCYGCNQGRLHKRCQQKCGRMLFCGHLCQEYCSSQCPPCKRKCETKCVHSKCAKQCFEPCVLCTEKCSARFQGNRKCSKLCSEPCDQKPSNKPCEKKLKCGHECIGLAEELCPKLCRVCDEEKVTDIFFGNEAEPDARFIQLECGHVFTYEDLDRWMEQESNEESETLSIQLKECPRCKQPIRTSKRYRHIINKQLSLINEVKKQINGNPADIETTRRTLLSAVKIENRRTRLDFTARSLYSKFCPYLTKLEQRVESARTMNHLAVIETQLQSLKRIYKVNAKLEEIGIKSTILSLTQGMNSDLTRLIQWLLRDRPYFSEQELEDFDIEFKRLKQCYLLIEIKWKYSTLPKEEDRAELLEKLEKVQKLLVDQLVRYDTVEKEVETLMEDIKNLCPKYVPGLGITEEEKNMIVKAMSFQKGHWNKCKNGHVYCIGDCGGATQEGKCPECNETIGGTGHRLAQGNSLAPVMDGATRPAYDPANFVIPANIFI